MRGKQENLLTSRHKLADFFIKKNLQNGSYMWKKNLKMCTQTFEVDSRGDISSELILNRLFALENNIAQFFSSITVYKYDWVRNPYSVSPPPFLLTKKCSSQNLQ